MRILPRDMNPLNYNSTRIPPNSTWIFWPGANLNRFAASFNNPMKLFPRSVLLRSTSVPTCTFLSRTLSTLYTVMVVISFSLIRKDIAANRPTPGTEK